MSEEKTHHVTLRLARGYEFVAQFDDVPGAPSILFDEPEPLGTNRAPNAAAVLGAAVGHCLAASLAFCLRKSRVDLHDLTVDVTTHLAKNEHGRFRVRAIDVELSPDIEAHEGTKFDRCDDLFEDFCIVTASVQRGIPVNISLHRPKDRAA